MVDQVDDEPTEFDRILPVDNNGSLYVDQRSRLMRVPSTGTSLG